MFACPKHNSISSEEARFNHYSMLHRENCAVWHVLKYTLTSDDAIAPKLQTPLGVELICPINLSVEPRKQVKLDTLVKFEFESSSVGMIMDKFSIDRQLKVHSGVIHSGSSVIVALYNFGDTVASVSRGESIAQMFLLNYSTPMLLEVIPRTVDSIPTASFGSREGFPKSAFPGPDIQRAGLLPSTVDPTTRHFSGPPENFSKSAFPGPDLHTTGFYSSPSFGEAAKKAWREPYPTNACGTMLLQSALKRDKFLLQLQELSEMFKSEINSKSSEKMDTSEVIPKLNL